MAVPGDAERRFSAEVTGWQPNDIESLLAKLEYFVCFTNLTAWAHVGLIFCGVLVGNIWHHAFVGACGDFALAFGVARRCGYITQRQETLHLVNITSFVTTIVPCYLLVVPDTGQLDLLFAISVLPMTFCLMQVLRAFLEVDDLIDRSTTGGFRLSILAMLFAGVGRCVCIKGDLWILSVMLPFLGSSTTLIFAMQRHAATLRDARCRLQGEISRSELARDELRQANSELQDERCAFSRILAALCDVTCRVDERLCFQAPTYQLYNLLCPGQPGTAATLEGHNLLDFVASPPADLERFHQFLTQPVTNPRQGLAEAFCVQMKAEDGSSFFVDIFHAYLGSRSRSPSHLLGIRLVPERSHPSEDTTLLRNRRGRLRCRDVQIISPSESVSQASASDDSADGSSSSGSETGDPESPVAADEVDPSTVAIRFDAGSPGFELCVSNQIVLSDKSNRRLRTLMDCIPAGTQHGFEQWIVREIHSAPWNQTVITAPLVGGLSLRLPSTARRTIEAKRAWLEIEPPLDDGTLPTTLWLRRLSRCRRGHKSGSNLAPWREEPLMQDITRLPTVSSASRDSLNSLTSSDASESSVASQGRLRRRGRAGDHVSAGPA